MSYFRSEEDRDRRYARLNIGFSNHLQVVSTKLIDLKRQSILIKGKSFKQTHITV